MATDDLNGLEIKSRLLSCYCDSCMDGEYEHCQNREWVDSWEDIEMEQEGIVRRVTRNGTEGEQASIKDLITEGYIVAIASGDPGEDYYLLKVTGQGPEELETINKDDWGASYPAGTEVISGHVLLPFVDGSLNHQHKIDQSRKAIVLMQPQHSSCVPSSIPLYPGTSLF